jgi:ribose transport system ATP-binding protein
MTDISVAETPRTAQAVRQDLLLEMVGICKRFAGEVHVLFGENGAGKSTLINIIAGAFAPDAGEFKFLGRNLVRLKPHAARMMGISPVFQEFSLVPELTVEENLFLGRELGAGGFLNHVAMQAKARAIIGELGFDIAPDQKVGELSRAHQQMVEIAKAFLTEVRLLILDEPTASLTEAETQNLFALVGRLKSAGVGIIYVSHRIQEFQKIGDRITVLRDGRKVATVKSGDVSENELVELMTGRKVGVLFPAIAHQPGERLLEVDDVTLVDQSARNVSFYARAGEITGIAGLVGCGKSEIVRAIYGLEPVATGAVRVKGEAIAARPAPIDMLRRGVCYFPSDRVAEGLALGRPIRENCSMAALDLPTFSYAHILRRASERRAVQAIVDTLKLRPPQIERTVAKLSGGNRQKVLLARGMTRDISVFLFDEPTVGIDVGAKIEVYEFMKSLVAAGAAIVLVSSDLPEVMNLSNRLYVMHRSQMVAELSGADINETEVLSHFFREKRLEDGLAPFSGAMAT